MLEEIVAGIIAYVILAIFVLFLLKLSYSTYCMRRAIDAVFRYCVDLIFNGKYDLYKNYYNEMLIDIDKHVFGFKFGKYSAIKPEYREVLKPYM